MIAQKDVLENEVNNGTYLALSTNNRKEIKSWFNYKASVTGFKVSSYIKKYSGNHTLTNYNFILIRHYIENYSLNNLVKLFKKVVNNEDGIILDDAKQGTLSCLIIKNQNKLVFQEINTITTYWALISSIKNLTANGFDLKMTKNIERLINKEVTDVHTLAEELKGVDFTPLKDEEDEA